MKGSELVDSKTIPKRSLEQRLKLERRLAKEMSPFTFIDLPLSYSGELFGSKYLFKGILGAGAFGLVISAIDHTYLEVQAIKVNVAIIVDYI